MVLSELLNEITKIHSCVLLDYNITLSFLLKKKYLFSIVKLKEIP